MFHGKIWKQTFISIHTPEKLFVGGYLPILEESVKKYYLMMGAAPLVFARDRSRLNQKVCLNIASGKGPKNWNFDNPIYAIFKKRFRRWEKTQQLTMLQLLDALQLGLAVDGQIFSIAGYIIYVASESQKLVKASKELRKAGATY